MKTFRIVGVLVAAGIGIGALLSAYLPDFNFGLGANGIGLPMGAEPAKPKTVGIDELPATDAEADAEAKSAAPPPKLVSVLIDDRAYLLRRGPEGKAAYKPANLDEVIQAAQSATGDNLGIRIRIEQKSSSRELTERALRTALREAGIPNDAIRWKDEPVD